MSRIEQVHAWKQLAAWRVLYAECEQSKVGYRAAEKVNFLLARCWSSLPELQASIEKDRAFADFVLERITGSTGEPGPPNNFAVLETINRNATKGCPRGLQQLCGKVGRRALKILIELENEN